MGKKGKKGSSSKKGSLKKGKKGGKKSVEAHHAAKKPQIDPEVLKELTKGLKDVFRFPNGDVYAGQFTVTSEGNVVREGWGSYFSGDGCTAAGRWSGDALVEADRARWPTGDWYRGPLHPADARFHGDVLGVYATPAVGQMSARFDGGRPRGVVTLEDLAGNKWQGLASEGGARLLPRNHFFDSEDEIWRREQQAKNPDGSFGGSHVSKQSADQNRHSNSRKSSAKITSHNSNNQTININRSTI